MHSLNMEKICCKHLQVQEPWSRFNKFFIVSTLAFKENKQNSQLYEKDDLRLKIETCLIR